MDVRGRPLISVIVCTRDRPEGLGRALKSVLLQDVDDFEVIVVDDGSHPPAEVPTDGRVCLSRTEHGGVGAARSVGLARARGEYVAYCDDDDEWKPGHLRALLEYLSSHPEAALVYADSDWAEGDGEGGVPYSFDFVWDQLRWGNYIFPTDVLHRADAARAAGGFDPSLRAHEDWDLWLRMSWCHRFLHLRAVLSTRHWRDDCVAAVERWDEWGRISRADQGRLDRSGPAVRHGLDPDAARPAPFDPETWRPGRRELIWYSELARDTSFAMVGRRLLQEAERHGLCVTMAPSRDQPVRGFERFYKPLDHWGRLAFYYGWRRQPSALNSPRVIAYTMWETDMVPAEQVDDFNRSVSLLYVPCRQNVESHLDAGVRVPIKVLHLGVDAATFPCLERARGEVFTFGSFGNFSARKGIDVLVRAFQDEFAPGEPVRLVLKGSAKATPYPISDRRVVLLNHFMEEEGLLEFLRSLDVMVMPSRGEGFGLCGLEAMATGLPLIATHWSGPAEYLNPADSFPLSYRLVEADGTEVNGTRYHGRWAEPSYEHLRALLRYVYEHPDEAASKGRLASERVHRHWTWDRVARQVCDDLDEIAPG
jgi:glycosyltransferase involved in cell wall biosynthesis